MINSVLPLSKKLSDDAMKIYEDLVKYFPVDFDESGSIGKRDRREDEIGTPFCVTIDDNTLETGIVTLRDRDTMEQVNLSVAEVIEYVNKKLKF